mmetsp:Transcript_31091/g.59921  ORF Transcript_31091/g.59921 Transcript_31091/m.59921 type:complete len:448 (-) Transcript_31091:433-1776(-)
MRDIFTYVCIATAGLLIQLFIGMLASQMDTAPHFSVTAIKHVSASWLSVKFGVGAVPDPNTATFSDSEILRAEAAKPGPGAQAQSSSLSSRPQQSGQADGGKADTLASVIQAPAIQQTIQPDELRRRAPALSATSREMRCGTPLPPESFVETRHGAAAVAIFARSRYRGTAEAQFEWTYEVDFENIGRLPVQLLTRYWVMTDDKGGSLVVKGPGAGGQVPVIPPGERWSYSSSTAISSERGSMHGSFQFETTADGESEREGETTLPPFAFSAHVGRLALSPSGREENVPCPNEAESIGRLPPTSVSNANRILVGTLVEYRPELSVPDASKYAFSYTITVQNARPAPVVFVSRVIKIVDERGHMATDEAVGLGSVEGKATAVQLDSGVSLRIQGTFHVGTQKGNLFGYLGARPDAGGQEATETVNIGRTGLSPDGSAVPFYDWNVFSK